MTKPKITKADAEGTPRCPHWNAALFSATVTIEDMMNHYPFGGWLSIGDDGYACEGEHLTTHCNECSKPVAVGFNSDADEWFSWMVKFAAARTHKDRQFKESHA
jgi:hypothetical protein